MTKIMNLVAEETGGKSYKAHKYSLDASERPLLDYSDGETTIAWKKTAETTQHRKYIDLSNLRKKLATQKDQILTYFLDGSRRVFKVDDIAYTHGGGRSVIYPVLAGQIGVACCRRTNKQMYPEKFKSEMVLVLPDIANTDAKPGFFPATAKKISQTEELKRLNISLSNILSYKTSKSNENKFEDRAIACIQDRMIKQEKEMVAELVQEGKLNQDNYLVKDGSLEYRPTKEDKKDSKKYQTFKNNYSWVLGASKNFNPEVCLDINGKSNPGFIADLPIYHRTPVACFENSEYLGDVQFAVWYIRIQLQSRTRTPFEGILKIEKILVGQDEVTYGIDSEQVDILSAYLMNERSPVCYGSDLRWANHLYPIYLTESYIKSKYLSIESFLHLF